MGGLEAGMFFLYFGAMQKRRFANDITLWKRPDAVCERLQRSPLSSVEMEVEMASDDISRPFSWRSCEEWHRIILHLRGRMDRLSTELEGHGGSSGPAMPGEVWSIPAQRAYASEMQGPGSIRYVVIHLNPRAGETHVSWDLLPVAGQRDTALSALVGRLAEAMQQSDDLSRLRCEELRDRIKKHLWQKYGMAGNCFSSPQVLQPTLTPQAVRWLREYIMERLPEDISLDEMAAVVAMSTHHLLIAFRKAFGVTPWQYVISQRLRQAQRLLLQGRLEVGVIALMCGFSSHSHLSTAFRKHAGCSPSAFRARESAASEFAL